MYWQTCEIKLTQHSAAKRHPNGIEACPGAKQESGDENRRREGT